MLDAGGAGDPELVFENERLAAGPVGGAPLSAEGPLGGDLATGGGAGASCCLSLTGTDDDGGGGGDLSLEMGLARGDVRPEAGCEGTAEETPESRGPAVYGERRWAR